MTSMAASAGAQPFAEKPRTVPAWAYAGLELLIAHGVVPAPASRQPPRRLNRGEVAKLLALALHGLTGRQSTDSGRRWASAADLATIQKLLNEFEPELASLDIRIDVAHRRLQQFADEIRPVRISGDFRFRYEVGRAALNNPGTGPVAPASAQPLLPTASIRGRLLFDAGADDDLRFKLRLSTFNQIGTTVGLFGGMPPSGHLNSMFIPLNSSADPHLGSINMYELEWTRAFGNPSLKIQLGHLGGDTWLTREGDPLIPTAPPAGRTTALQLGPIGLLFNTAKDTVGERSVRTYAVDALVVTYAAPQFGVVAIAGGSGSATFYAGRIQAAPAPDVVVGGNVVTNSCIPDGGVDNALLVNALTAVGVGAGVSRCSFVWWGAQNGWIPALNTGSTNPITNLDGTGYSVDFDAGLASWLRFQGELGVWSDSAARRTGYGWQAQVVVGDPKGFVGVLGYQSFDAEFTPSFGAAEDPVVGFIYPGGFQDLFVAVQLPQFAGWVITGGYESGTVVGVGPQPAAVGFGGPAFSAAVCPVCSPAGQPFSGWLVSVTREIAPATTLHLYYYGWQFSGASQAEIYRLELGHQF